MKSQISVTFIIPTHNSSAHLRLCLESIKNQCASQVRHDIFVVDNQSDDDTLKIARAYGAKIYTIKGAPPMVCTQRNIGFQKSKNTFVYFLDHDMTLPPDFLQQFKQYVLKNPGITAIQVPENVIGNSRLMSRLKTFEKRAYEGTAIAAARIIHRSTLQKLGLVYDEQLSGGPADWDMELQLAEKGCSIGVLPHYVFHNEANMSIFASVKKRTGFKEGVAQYSKKWKKRDETVYNAVIVGKQLNPWYRLFGVFFRSQQIVETLSHFGLYILLICYKFAIGLGYLRTSI